MTLDAPITRPEFTFPELEGTALRGAYAQAEVILEYGSGGSTVMGAEMPGTRVFSVESDKAWAQMMRGWFAESPPADGSEAEIAIRLKFGIFLSFSNPMWCWSMAGFARAAPWRLRCARPNL